MLYRVTRRDQTPQDLRNLDHRNVTLDVQQGPQVGKWTQSCMGHQPELAGYGAVF